MTNSDSSWYESAVGEKKSKKTVRSNIDSFIQDREQLEMLSKMLGDKIVDTADCEGASFKDNDAKSNFVNKVVATFIEQYEASSIKSRKRKREHKHKLRNT